MARLKKPKIKKIVADTGPLGAGELTADNTLILKGKAAPRAKIVIYENGIKIGVVKANKKGKWKFETDSLSDGHSDFSAKAKSGHRKSGVSKQVGVEIDATAPVAPSQPALVSLFDTGGPTSGYITRDATPTLTGLAEAGSTVAIKDGASLLGSTVANSSGVWIFTTGGLAYGAHLFTATATDKVGNTGPASAALAVTINDGPLAATIVVADTVLTTGETSLVTITFSQAVSGFDNADLTLDNGTLSPVVSVDGGTTWTATLTPTADLTDTSNVITLNNAGVTGVTGGTGVGTTTSNTYAIDTDGSASVVDLGAISSGQGFIINGDAAGDEAGWSVSSAGDVNGDGFDDVIVGARYGDDGGVDAGEAYVVFGKAGGFGTIELSSLAAAEGFIIQGDAADNRLGRTVSSAGDVNGDGFDDLIVGARLNNNGGYHAGEAYVIFGSGSGFGATINAGGHDRQVIDVTTLLADEGFVILGDVAVDHAGNAVSSAGDVNGDGLDDVVVGAYCGDDGGSGSGEAYVIFGSTTGFGTPVDTAGHIRNVIDLTSLSSAEGFIIQGDAAVDINGQSVSSAGDVNGDGIDDLIVGAIEGDDGGTNAGEAYVVFGSKSELGVADATNGHSRQVIDLTTLSSSQGFIIQGDSANDNTGYSVSSAGDVNGDGFDDLLIGARRGDDGGVDAGEAYVVFGKAGGFGQLDNANGHDRQVIDLTTLLPADGFVIRGSAAHDLAGNSVSSAGDINGDGFDDLIVGAPRDDDVAGNAGAAYVIFGKVSGFGILDASNGYGREVVDLSNLAAPTGFVIQGEQGGDNAGSSVAAAGDVNGDGFDDLVVGAPNGGALDTRPGTAYVLFGGTFGNSTAPVIKIGTGAAEILLGGAGADQLSGGGNSDVIRAGAGNDVITVADLAFSKIDGGSGTDTLVFAGPGEIIDFSLIADNRIDGIEVFDVRGTGNDTLIIGALDILHFSDKPNAFFSGASSHTSLVIFGDAGDTLDLDGFDPDGVGPVPGYAWTLVASGKTLDGAGSGGLDFYDLVRDTGVVASVAVDSDMSVLLDP